MPKNMKVCRVCGKTYESCRSIKTGSAVFNWREMCCSPECGSVYFRRIEEARHGVSKTKAKKRHAREEKPVVEDAERSAEDSIASTTANEPEKQDFGERHIEAGYLDNEDPV